MNAVGTKEKHRRLVTAVRKKFEVSKAYRPTQQPRRLNCHTKSMTPRVEETKRDRRAVLIPQREARGRHRRAEAQPEGRGGSGAGEPPPRLTGGHDVA